jgi:hypothetical protein
MSPLILIQEALLNEARHTDDVNNMNILTITSFCAQWIVLQTNALGENRRWKYLIIYKFLGIDKIRLRMSKDILNMY